MSTPMPQDMALRLEKGNILANTKFKPYLEATQTFYKASKGRNMPDRLKAVMGITMGNMQRHFEQLARSKGYLRTEGLTTSDLGTYIRHGFELISAIIPSSILEEIVSVQPMDRKTGQVFWMDYIYETARGSVATNSTMFHAQTGGFAEQNYTSEYVQNAQMSAAGVNIAGTVSYLPLKAGSTLTVHSVTGAGVTQSASVIVPATWATVPFTIPLAGNPALAVAVDVTASVVSGVPNTYLLTLANGQWNVAANASGTQLDYQIDLDANPNLTPKVKLGIREQVVVAEKDVLTTEWLLDAAFEMEQHYGKSIEEETVMEMAGYIRAEIDQRVIRDIYSQAEASVDPVFDATNPVFISELERAQDFIRTIQRNSSQIHKGTRRMQGATFLMAGRNVADYINVLPETFFKRESVKFGGGAGPFKIGRLLGSIDVYKALDCGMTDNQYFVGAKGDNWNQAGYAWLPFIPVMVTEKYPIGNGVYQRYVVTKNAKAMLNNKFYVKSSVSGL